MGLLALALGVLAGAAFALRGRAEPLVLRMHIARGDAKLRLAFELCRPEGWRGAERAFLERVARDDPDETVRAYSARAVGALPELTAADLAAGIPFFIDERADHARARRIRQVREAPLPADLDEPDPSIRSIAVGSLAHVAGRDLAGRFLAILGRSERTNERAEAALFFARAGLPEDVPALERAYSKEPLYYVRAKIREAIARIGS
ncbi:MAG TPA: HEAT repeat domain-containing protein [Planctomycetota bacterium]|nr:HEAT repeat domain-containing protein [Planctomycetota bacterium]